MILFFLYVFFTSSLPIDITSTNSGDKINKKIHDDLMIGKSPLAKGIQIFQLFDIIIK